MDSSQFRAEFYTADERESSFEGNGLRVSFTGHETYPYTVLQIDSERGRFSEKLLYAHLALGRLLTEFDFHTVLEIGSRNGVAARAMEFAGKDVYTVEVQQHHAAKYNGDYLDVRLDEPVDAIWCSHVLEHQRNVGQFCEKMFADLRDGGVLALTVPSELSPLVMGHPNIFTPGHVLYQLILAGFDCSQVSVKQYDLQFSVLLRKKANGIPKMSFALTPFAEDGIGFHPDLYSYFPPHFRDSFTPGGLAWGEVEAIDW